MYRCRYINLLAIRSQSQSCKLNVGNSGQEELDEVVQETLPLGRWTHRLPVAIEQAKRFAFRQRRLDRREFESRAFAEQADRNALDQPQCVEHDLERKVGARQDAVLHNRIAGGRKGHVLARLLGTGMPLDAVRKTDLAVGART